MAEAKLYNQYNDWNLDGSRHNHDHHHHGNWPATSPHNHRHHRHGNCPALLHIGCSWPFLHNRLNRSMSHSCRSTIMAPELPCLRRGRGMRLLQDWAQDLPCLRRDRGTCLNLLQGRSQDLCTIDAQAFTFSKDGPKTCPSVESRHTSASCPRLGQGPVPSTSAHRHAHSLSSRPLQWPIPSILRHRHAHSSSLSRHMDRPTP